MTPAAVTGAPLGVLLMSFGSAVTAEDVPEYLHSVRSGREVPGSVVEEFRRRYRLIGRSPLIDITREQASALQAELDARHGPGSHEVGIGMLHSEPRIRSALEQLASAGAREAVAIVLAPHFSPIIMGGYQRAVHAAVGSDAASGSSDAASGSPHAAARSDGVPGPMAPVMSRMRVVLAGSWHRTEGFVAALAGRVVEALAAYPEGTRSEVPVIFTAHSLPRSVVDRDPGYIDQLRETVELVADRAGIGPERRQFAFQSAGHTPEEWLRPDFRELLAPLRAAGHGEVLVVPTQFLADHLEVLYDIDIAGQEEARREGVGFRRIAMPNTSPELIRALADVVDRDAPRGGSSGRLRPPGRTHEEASPGGSPRMLR